MDELEICSECTGMGKGLYDQYCKVCGGTGYDFSDFLNKHVTFTGKIQKDNYSCLGIPYQDALQAIQKLYILLKSSQNGNNDSKGIERNMSNS